jgi:hypothetical protein
MRTNDLISLYVSFVETNGGKPRPVLIRKVSEQTVEAFRITNKYQNKISDFALDLKSKRRDKGQKILQQQSSKKTKRK